MQHYSRSGTIESYPKESGGFVMIQTFRFNEGEEIAHRVSGSPSPHLAQRKALSQRTWRHAHQVWRSTECGRSLRKGRLPRSC